MSRVSAVRIATAIFLATALVPVSVASKELAANSPPLKCDIGPVIKKFGATQWLVYSCDDRRTVVIVSAPGNPAMPFYFTFHPGEKGYRLMGEGTGGKDATAAAFDELKALSEPDITALIEQTEQR